MTENQMGGSMKAIIQTDLDHSKEGRNSVTETASDFLYYEHHFPLMLDSSFSR